MNIDVIGSGSIGMLMAAKLLQTPYHVHLWTRSEQAAAVIRNRGIVLHTTDHQNQHVYHCPCSSMELIVEQDEILAGQQEEWYAIIAVKQTHIHDQFLEQLDRLARLRRYRAIMVIQNGVGHVRKIASIMAMPIISVVTSEGAKRQGLNEVVHAGSGTTVLGDELGRDKARYYQKKLGNALEIAGFTVFVSKNIKEHIYRKLMLNAVINPLTALFNVTNGELPESSTRLVLMKQLFQESKEILLEEEPALAACTFDEVLGICQATAANTSSMRADVLAGRRTEIASINGAIATIAATNKKNAPLNESMVHIIEALHPENKE